MKKEVVVVALCLVLVCFISGFENVKAEVKGILLGESVYGGMIYPDTFSISIPKHMTIGESYRALVDVKNSGTRADFLVVLAVPSEFIYVDSDAKMIELDEGESRIIVFIITPTKSHIGELNITAKLYLLTPEIIALDIISDSVLLIESVFSTEDVISFIISILFVMAAIALLTRYFQI